MKMILNLIVLISSIPFLLLSCAKHESENDKKPNDDSNMITVSLGITGDILEVEETPLSKTTETADIYGVQIYSSPKGEDNYLPYGYGLFVDKSKMQIKLFKNRKYKFEMTTFLDNRINRHVQFIGGNVFDGNAIIADSIVYSESDSLEVSRSPYWHENFTNVDRYYGKLVDYVPTENAMVNIDLKRVVAGLTFHIKGLSNQSVLMINYDSIFLKIEGNGMVKEIIHNSLICLKGERATSNYEYYYTDQWFENPVEELELIFTLTDRGYKSSFKQTVTIKRKTNHTFQINIPEIFLTDNGIIVTEEEAEWDNDVIIDNIYFGDLIIENEKDLETLKNAKYTKIVGNLIFKYWNANIGSSRGYDIEGDLKFIATEKCRFNDLYDFVTGGKVGGNLEFIATVPKCFCGLGYLKALTGKIGGDFKLIGTQGSFVNLYNIYGSFKEIGGKLEITTSDSDSFNRFHEIGSQGPLEKIGGDIILKNLPAFRSYCDLKTVLQNHKGQFIVSGNAYNPTKEQILAGECSKP